MHARATWTATWTTVAGLTLGLVGCTGSILGGSEGRSGATPGAPTTPGPGAGQMPPGAPATPAPAGVTAGAAPLRRLNGDQYRNTIQDLLGLGDLVTEGSLPPDDAIGDERFLSNVFRPVQGADLDRYANLAEAIARKATTDLQALLGVQRRPRRPAWPASSSASASAPTAARSRRRRASGPGRWWPRARTRPAACGCWCRRCSSRPASFTWWSRRPRPRRARWWRSTAGRWPRGCLTSSSTACPTATCSRRRSRGGWARPTRSRRRPPA